MKSLLSLKKQETVEEYPFKELVYNISIYNTYYEDQFFISQFIRGLNTEIRGVVESQVPAKAEHAYLLAQV
jgi:hypothetical protein